MNVRTAAAALAAAACFGLAGCAQPTAGSGVPGRGEVEPATSSTTTVTAPPPVTVVVPPTRSTVYVPSPDPVIAPEEDYSGLTPCQRMSVDG